jgi:hypothetical protein
MKYFFRILIVLVLAVGVVFGVYYYTNPDVLKNNDSDLTTVTKLAATEKYSDKQLIASLEDEDYYLYQSGKTVILNHDGKDYEFENWSNIVESDSNEMYYADFDNDNENEILVKAVIDVDNDLGDYVYNIYLLNPAKDSDGNLIYNVAVASRNVVNNILEEYIIEEVSQLKSCNKIVQFAMASSGTTIEYDKTTGAATNGHVGYFRALQDLNGSYLSVSKFSKGNSTFNVTKDNKIKAEVEINISYNNSTVTQSAGIIRFGLTVSDDNSFTPTEKSLSFIPSDDYKVSDPTTADNTSWSYTENNSDKSKATSDNTIDWIQYSSNYDSTITTQTQNFSSSQDDMKNISKVVITNNSVELSAKSGCSFDKQSANKGEFSVIINKGTDDEYEISYTASVTDNVLKIKFDKSYPKSEIKSVYITYGSK